MMYKEPCHITLAGPVSYPSTLFRRITVQFEVGSENCPDIESLTVCLNAIKDLIKVSDGVMSDAVVEALKAHVHIVSLEQFEL